MGEAERGKEVCVRGIELWNVMKRRSVRNRRREYSVYYGSLYRRGGMTACGDTYCAPFTNQRRALCVSRYHIVSKHCDYLTDVVLGSFCIHFVRIYIVCIYVSTSVCLSYSDSVVVIFSHFKYDVTSEVANKIQTVFY